MSWIYTVLATTPTKIINSSDVAKGILSLPFFEVYLSAFLGFLSALIVETINDHISIVQKRKQIIKNLIAELTRIKNEAEKLEDMKLYPLPYSCPFWKGICLSGSVLVLDKLECYLELVRIFEKIEEANYMEGKCFEIIMSIHEKHVERDMIETILENRENLLNEIDQGLNLLKEVK